MHSFNTLGTPSTKSSTATPKEKNIEGDKKGKGKGMETKGAKDSKEARKDSKGGKGDKKGTTYCAKFYTDAGCSTGEACKKHHPTGMGRCFRCGSLHHGLAECSRPTNP
eukprot:523820-Amphidinium_carterae.1